MIDKKLVFVHIPKTAGTTIHEMLVEEFEESLVCPERFRGLGKYTEEQLNQYRFFSGHFLYPMVNRIPGNKFVFTCFRDPAERIVSLYYFWKRHRAAVVESLALNGPRVARLAGSLKNFLKTEDSATINAIKNEMCRALVGYVVPEPNGRYSEYRQKEKVEVFPTDLLRRALGTLGKLDFVMFVDSLERDFDILCKMLDIPPIRNIPKINTRFERKTDFEEVIEEKIDEEDREILAYLTDLDVIVYRCAKIRQAEIIRNL